MCRPSLLLLAVLAAPLAAHAQGFTRLALTDTLFADERRTDFFVGTALPGDADGDGDMDLMILGTWVRYGPRPVDDIEAFEDVFRVFLNDGPVGDTAWAFSRGPEIPIGDARSGPVASAWGDYDNDGDLDLAYAPGSDSATCCFRGALRLFRNDGATFVRDSIPNLEAWDYGASQLDVRTISWADTDNDGDLDLLLPGVYEFINSTFVTTAVVLRNDGPGENGWTWTRTEPGLPGRTGAASVWADMDGDGDLDVLLGTPVDDGTGGAVLRTWQNDGGLFTPAGPPLPAYYGGTVDWQDMDGDGDLDVLLSGRTSANASGAAERAAVYVHQGDRYDETLVLATGAVPQPDGQQERWFDVFAASWADYDSDGDLDVLAAGSGVRDSTNGWVVEHFGRAIVFRNDGAAGGGPPAFVPADTLASLYGSSSGTHVGAFAWLDVDGDGDLDHMAAGTAYSEDYQIPYGNVKTLTYLYRNDAPGSNAAPSAPSGLTAQSTPDGAALAWTAASDDHTPSASLTYNLHVRTADGQDVVSPHARGGGGGRLVPEAGNVSHDLRWRLRDLAPGTYTWAVQAIDNAFNGGAFAPGGTFVIGTVAGEGAPAGPAVLALGPNPAAGDARATLVLPTPTRATVEVFDALGRRVATLADTDLAAGTHRWPLAAARLAPGTYTVRARLGTGDAATVLVGRLAVVR